MVHTTDYKNLYGAATDRIAGLELENRQLRESVSVAAARLLMHKAGNSLPAEIARLIEAGKHNIEYKSDHNAARLKAGRKQGGLER